MRRIWWLLLLMLSICGIAQSEISSIETAYSFTQPEEDEYIARTWSLTIEKYSQEMAKESLAFFAPGVHADLERERLRGNMIFSLYDNPVTLRTITYHSEHVAPLSPQEPLLTFLGWTNVYEMTSIRADEAYALWDISGLHAKCTFEQYLERKGFPPDAMSEVHVLWQTIDDHLVYPDTIASAKEENYPIYAELTCDGKRTMISAQFGLHILDVEPIEYITASLSPTEAAEKVVQYDADYWKDIHGITGTVRITADQVIQGYWVDSKRTAHPGWLVHIWSIQHNDKGVTVYVSDYWAIVDFLTGNYPINAPG